MAQSQESAANTGISAQSPELTVDEAGLNSTAAMNASEAAGLPLRPRANTTASNDSHDSPNVAQQPGTGAEDGIGNDQGDQPQGDYGEVSKYPPAEVEKKKKRKKVRPQSKRGINKPTGFEEYFADPPLTPEQYAEEQEIYHPGLLFVDRIATAIARFERTRKLTSQRGDVLHKYLIYGGLARSANVCQGGQDTEGMDKTQIALIQTQFWISEDKRDLGTETSVYEVDFLACAKGFLSRRAKDCFGLDTEDEVNMVCTTLERFLDYLLQHDVCPEYKEDILAARALCRQAGPELWDMAEATRRLPGEFNVACSTLFGGSYSRDYDGETWWGNPDTEGPVFVGLKPEEAQQIVRFGDHTPVMLDVVSTQERAGFEVIRIEPPTRECKKIYTTHSEHFRPVGRVYAKPWKNPDAAPEDLTPSEQAASSTSSSRDAETEYVFFIESILQTCLRVGTKVEATIRTLGCGIMFFDQVLNVYPTFDEFLVNEMMVGWKEPRPLKGSLAYVAGDDSDGEDDGGGDEGGNVGAGNNVAVAADETVPSK
ncbi:hypothetical protein CLAIMM_11433 [Cladophialophora immunda]|nr:hypothetical protein CLAIMM_11433 [Cladophialophora immunda]